MGAGLQVFDASGEIVSDDSTQIGRVLGYVDTGTSDGSLTNATLAEGKPWYQIMGLDVGYYCLLAEVSFSGTTMSWTFNGSTYKNSCRIIYGVYNNS